MINEVKLYFNNTMKELNKAEEKISEINCQKQLLIEANNRLSVQLEAALGKLKVSHLKRFLLMIFNF